MWVPPVIIHFPWKICPIQLTWGIPIQTPHPPRCRASHSPAWRAWRAPPAPLEADSTAPPDLRPRSLGFFFVESMGFWRNKKWGFLGKVGENWGKSWKPLVDFRKLEECWRIGMDFRGNMLEITERLPQLSWHLMGSGYLELEGSRGKNHQKLDVCLSIDLTCLSSVTQLSTDSVEFRHQNGNSIGYTCLHLRGTSEYIHSNWILPTVVCIGS